jgi:2-dehydro-3-deoxygalactonokinase
MSAASFIACDWGTSNMRLYLCACHDDRPTVLDARNGPGVATIDGEFESVFFQLADDWITAHGNLPVILSGMVGSTIGWNEAPYLQCPVNARQIVEGRLQFAARGTEFCLVAGLRADNPLGSPDVMRGEELQLLGWLHAAGNKNAPQLFALPGTHNKWALLDNGRVETLLTALTGELFELIEKHSILVGPAAGAPFNAVAFKDGVNTIGRLGEANLLHALFATRSRQVLGTMPAADASSYLSGLIIGADVSGATALFRRLYPNISNTTLIGDAELMRLYRIAHEELGIEVHECDATQVALAGYAAIYRCWYGDLS